MSWLNNSLNTIKGQLSTLAHEILEETAGPGDTEYRGPESDNRTIVEKLADMEREKADVDKLCSEKEQEIVALRKQIEILQNQTSDTGGGIGSRASGVSVVGSGGATGSGRTSKTPTDNNASTLEDSWCWEPDNVKSDNDHSSETSSGNGNEMVNITLEEIPLGASAKATNKTKIQRLGKANDSDFQKRLLQLEEENKQLSNSLEELDTQHNVAMQNMLELKTDLQEKLSKVSKDYETLKSQQEERFVSNELEMARLKKLNETLEQEKEQSAKVSEDLKQKLSDSSEEIKKTMEYMDQLQSLLEKKNLDNKELIERIKETQMESEQEKTELNEKVELLTKELEELKGFKLKKTSESSQSSSGKQSEDEFIVVREQDAHSSAATPPPTKEELKDRIVQLENRLSELTLENGSLSLKLHDRDMEKDLAVKVLKENIQTLQNENDELNEKLRMSLIELEDQLLKINDLKEKACETFIDQERLKQLNEDKLKIADEVAKLKESFKNSLELEKRLLLSEQEKEVLQLEMQSTKTELEQKIQKLTYENQHLTLNAEAETETLNNNNELEQKLKDLTNENLNLKAELERSQESPHYASRANESKKQCVTDLDDDDNHESSEESFDWEKLQQLIKAFASTKDVKELNTEDYEQMYKNLRERLSKIEALQSDLAHMSAEVMELQDSKVVWDHEKKTLEADISQYILQCDELMKNNEILLNELENYKRNKLETIPENNEENIVQLECQLDECNKLNRTLEQEYIELNEKIEELEKENQCMNEKLRESQQNAEALNIKEKDLNLQVETLELEKCNLLLQLNDIDSNIKEDHKDKELIREYQEKAQSLEKQLSALAKDHADLVNAMQKQKDSLMETIQQKDEIEKVLRQNELMARKQKEDQEVNKEQAEKLTNSLTAENEKLKQELLANNIVCDSLKEEIKILLSNLKETELLMGEKLLMQQQILEKSKALEEHKEEFEKMSNSLTAERDRLKQELLANNMVCDTLKDEIKMLKSCFEESELLMESKLLLQEQITEKAKALEEYKEELEIMKKSHEELQKELDCLKTKTETDFETASSSINNDNLALVKRIAELEQQLLSTADMQKNLDTLIFEKQEMIKALQQKHAENMQYYMEIQRLTPLVQKAFVEQKPCDKCLQLESQLVDLRKEQEKHQDQINFLKEKSDILTTNLLTEQTNQKLVQQEKADVMEQNANLRKDVERLRAHLLEIEDMHTQESVEMQRELEETKSRMLSLEEEVSKSSKTYTSASIRANQHAETLQAQYSLLVQQRDELLQKLSLAEDRESKNQAALTNLQCALEQFQNDRENDIKLATQRIRKELQQHLDKEAQFHVEIQQLQQQLSDATLGLNAASRLTDQLESCQQTINVLREEVDSLKQQNSGLEQKLSSTESSQSDKIEKTLIKSLLIGYVVIANPNDKLQILRMISSVLDFNQGESDKVGLNKQQGGWLGSLLGSGSGAAGSHSKDNLVQAFVQFLEKESQPQPQQMPNLLNITHSSSTSIQSNQGLSPSSSPATVTATNSRRSSNTSIPSSAAAASPAPVPIQPLLLNSSVLDEFAPSRNSSSILKDILNDS